MTESSITRLLSERHRDDVFVPQCKNGSTHYAESLLKLDAWAMAKSWKHPKLTAYEIKVSRSDFLHDDKWRHALDYCNEFYWVAPQGIIDPAEIDPQCGLLIVSKNATKLYNKKKAVYREIPCPDQLLYYVLMCRASIKGEDTPPSRTECWRKWLAERDEAKELGWNVSKKIREVVAGRINKVAGENRELRTAIKNYETMVLFLEQRNLGHFEESERGRFFVPVENWIAERRLAADVVPEYLPNKLRQIADDLDKIKENGTAHAAK